ncbi:FAD/NAD(P)-binding domain-containing protein [Neurospora tetraspora]|uniref:FAD/NAD(P)-binding domain-containing protein n=1 Tax=Neurospora tetraspora TaxID=94610 RepID=A0AAE0MXV9_9PEZI|nr:FAD/NAD(P)-binding domain-containing protein [Neurospora tetraspora]
MAAPKKVCIVGAGPSGLVAAKSLLHDQPKGTFDVTIFEAQNRLGGLWPSRKDDNAGFVHPLMAANQSKHTVQFSDLAWPDDAPEFPRAWHIGRYLERYHDRYCQDAKLCLGERVVHSELLEGAKWKVRTCSQDGQQLDHTFDYLLVASGFFGKPVIPPPVATSGDIPVVHSSQYRTLSALLEQTKGAGRKIVVVGGQMSGVEIAGTIATHLSSALHSPGSSTLQDLDKYSIHHVCQRPVWVFPLFTSPKPASPAPPFLPMDLCSYNLANRPDNLTNMQGHVSTEAAKTRHSIFETMLGTDQSDFSPSLAITNTDTDKPPYLAVSDTYADFVRSGLISVSHGKVDSLTGSTVTVTTARGDVSKIDNVAAVVLATGFEAASSISFLPSSVQETLSVVPSDLNTTVALAFHGTHHPAIPSLGFVGFYRSPYWGVMEMQARFVTALWTAGGPASSSLPPKMAVALGEDDSIERTLALRTDPRVSQFPMGDYPWLMQEFSKALEIDRIPPLGKMPRVPPADKSMDILTPARYPAKRTSEAQRTEVDKSIQQTESTTWSGVSSARFVAKAVFRSLLGEWKLERDLVSRLPTHPSGHFSGTARFLLRERTRDGREAEHDAALDRDDDIGLEYLYVEEGMFAASNGLSFRATRRYVWRYDEKKDKLSVWFVKTDDQKRADYLFHQVEFIIPDTETEGAPQAWRANAGHLCIDDFYDVDYRFNFKAINLKDWSLAYRVKGPQKDYIIEGTYTR